MDIPRESCVCYVVLSMERRVQVSFVSFTHAVEEINYSLTRANYNGGLGDMGSC